MKKKLIVSLIAGILFCLTTNLNVFAADREDVDESYKSYYEIGLNMQIDEATNGYNISSSDDSIQWVADKTNETLYTTTTVFARESSPNQDNKNEMCLPAGTAVTRVGISGNGWDLIEYQDKMYFMWYAYLEEQTKAEIEDNINMIEAIAEVQSHDSEDLIEGFPEVVEKEPEVAPAYNPEDFKWMGVISWGGYRWTYYSQRVLPGPGLSIPGRHVGAYGFVCDENEYICLASSDLSYGTVVDTPFGMKGKVYDCGCASGTLDCYCDW